jgi:hypothetical protein
MTLTFSADDTHALAPTQSYDTTDEKKDGSHVAHLEKGASVEAKARRVPAVELTPLPPCMYSALASSIDSLDHPARHHPTLGGVDEEIAQLEDPSIVITPEDNKRYVSFSPPRA